MIKSRRTSVIELQDWDDMVVKTYGRPYSFQQQGGCKSRGTYELTVPCKHPEDYDATTLPDEVNGRKMGVSFAAWLARDPKEWNGETGGGRGFCIELFWERNFYPHVEMVANDLHKRGLLDAGEYLINIDW